MSGVDSTFLGYMRVEKLSNEKSEVVRLLERRIYQPPVKLATLPLNTFSMLSRP